jgi:DnaJ-class molecular chaperone
MLEADGDRVGAMKDFQAVRRIDPRNKKAESGIQRIAKADEAEKNVDFYEVLGLKKGCSAAQVKAAYKVQARKWHPDRFPDPVEKRNAEKKMKNLNRAVDVLGDPQKRQLYDQGIDPDSGMPQDGQGFNPGAQGFPFGGFQFGGAGFPGGGGFQDMFQGFFQQGGGRRIQFHFG